MGGTASKPSPTRNITHLQAEEPPLSEETSIKEDRRRLRPATVKIHSHNDEMQDVPLNHALSLGFLSIEVDTWEIEGVLCVGHTRSDLKVGNTLQSVYMNPLWKHLEERNEGEGSGEARDDETEGRGWMGIHEEDPGKSLLLIIDMKGDGTSLWNHLLPLLQPFLERGWLTTFQPTSPFSPLEGTATLGPLTIIGSGSTPAPLVYALQSPRYIFYDAPLLTLTKPLALPPGTGPNGSSSVEWHPSFSPTATSKLPLQWYIGSPWMHFDKIKAVVDTAHAIGIEARWWGVWEVGWVGWRVAMWTLLKRAGTDWVNADDLEGAASFEREWIKTEGLVGGDGDGKEKA